MLLKTARIELFFSNPKELRERVRFLHTGYGISAFNLVNKHKNDAIQEFVNIIHEEVPDANVCAHFSLKFNRVPRKGFEEHYNVLQTYLSTSTAQHVLLISGSGEKKPWNVADALERLGKDDVECDSALCAAYNPYFPDDALQTQENARLAQKIASGKVKTIYLQFGTDLSKLRSALEMLTKKYPTVSISGSLFLPTAKLIAQQKFRPWNGVFLSREFLSSPVHATGVIVQMMTLCKKYNVEMLWEAPGIRNEKDMAVLEGLYEECEKAQGTEIPSGPISGTVPKRQKVELSKKVTSLVTARDTLIVAAELLEQPCILLVGSHDVRLHDNRAVELATKHKTMIPVFLWDKGKEGKWGVHGALQVVLKDALQSLDKSLEEFGLKLVCRNCNDSTSELESLVDELGAGAVYWNREHTTESRIIEKERRESLEKRGVHVTECQSSLLYDPEQVSLLGGFNEGHWGTLMPFLKHCKKQFGEPSRPTARYETFRTLELTSGPAQWPSSEVLSMAAMSPRDKWDKPILERFPMSEKQATETLNAFFSQGFIKYETERSRADKDSATSKLSAHLRIGTLSPYELYWKTQDSTLAYEEKKTFSRRLIWRDLAYYQLFCFPEMRHVSIRRHYENTEWVSGEEEVRRFDAWKLGKTGFPIVDAGMRELYATGWMTQNIRMVVASFLTEFLRVNWVKGCEWFHYTLVDADSAINAMMWQNAGRSGIDQWNFVLSPETASQDPSGDYTRKWIPELAQLPTTGLLHRPWQAPEDVLTQAAIVLGETYPNRVVVDLKKERTQTVKNVLDMRRNSQGGNDDRGYDLITLPDNEQTVVFTKKEYRIDREGNVMTASSKKKVKTSQKGTAREMRRRRMKMAS
jgi:deoxyribodipyrimidine photo-lyase